MYRLRRLKMSSFTRQQEQAIKASGNTLVSAGAGSGKTTVLSHRLIHLLKNGVSLDRVLVLTFTENAALNMKKKIKTLLKNEEGLAHQIKLVDGSDIMTFDAFNQKIVKKYRPFLSISEDFKVVNEAIFSVIKREYLRKRFDDLYREQNIDLCKILLRYTKKSDDLIFDFILKLEEKLSNKADPLSYLTKMMAGLSESEIDDVYQKLFINYQKQIKIYLQEIDNFGLDNKFMTSLLQMISPLLQCQSFDAMKSLMQNFPRMPAARGLDEEMKASYKQVTNIFKEVKQIVNLIPFSHTFKTIYQNQRSYIQFIYREVLALRKFISEYKEKNNAYSFSDIAAMVIRLLKENENIEKELKEHYQCVMVDEYQDNSDIQEEVISMLNNDNLFLVGDVKQSIYRFRNANPKLFMNRYQEYLKGEKGSVIDMNDNFRSTPSVIDDINFIFSNLMSLEFGGADYQAHHLIKASNTKYQGFHQRNRLITASSEGLNAEDIAKEEIELTALDIKNRIKTDKTKFSDYAIILDRYQYFDKVIKIFSDHGIPVGASFNSNLVSHDLSMILLNIFRLLLFFPSKVRDVKFKHAFYSVARSYLYEMEDTRIYEVMEKGDYQSTPVYQDMKTILESVKDQPLIAIMDEVVKVIKLPSKIIKTADYKSDLKILEAFYQNVAELSKLGYDLAMMIEHFKAISSFDLTYSTKIQNQSDNAVTLISIHSSKGLEYNHCYFLSLSKRYNERDLIESVKFDDSLGIILPIGPKDYLSEGATINDMKNPLEVYYKTKEKIEERSEHLRLLYVALTRAMRSMTFVFIDSKKTNLDVSNCNSFMQLLDFISYRSRLEEIEVNKELEVEKPHVSKSAVDYGFNYHELALAKPEAVAPTMRASKSAVHVSHSLLKRGERIHAALEIIDLKKPDLSLIKNEQDQVLIRNLLDQEIFRNIEEAKIYQEYEFIDEQHKTHGIIDLLLIFKDRVLIVDYKLKNIDDPEYRKQLEVYRDYIATKLDLPIELYLYSLVEGKLNKLN